MGYDNIQCKAKYQAESKKERDEAKLEIKNKVLQANYRDEKK